MKQSKTLAWLLDEDWKPKQVKKFIGISNEEFDEMQSKLYGYDSVSQMNAHNYSRDMQKLMNYGDRAKGLI